MSEPEIAKSDADLSSNSSWSVIEETDDSRKSSLENILENDSDNVNTARSISNEERESDDTYINIPEEDPKTMVDELNEDNKLELLCFDELKEKSECLPGNQKSKGKRRKKHKAEPLSLLSIAASVLTITGLTLLCMLFPQNIESEDLSLVENNYADVVTLNSLKFDDIINKTSEAVDVVNKANLFQNILETASDDNFTTEVCIANNQTSNKTIIDKETIDESLNFNVPTEAETLNYYKLELEEEKVDEKSDEKELISSFEELQNRTMGLIKDLEKVLMNPNLQIFLCTLMQDICLIKLVKQLNKPEFEKENRDPLRKTDNVEVKSEKSKIKKAKKISNPKRKVETKAKDIKKNKEELSELNTTKIDKIEDISSQDMIVSQLKFSIKPEGMPEELINNFKVKDDMNSDRENGKSECERRFEDLDNKWENASNDHRRNIQEIKENFKNEVQHIKEQEKELSQRRRKITMLREKYIDRLKLDRERYLFQLRKLRDDHHRVMRELCLKKNRDKNLKDASVGNYAVLLPDSYNFQQKLALLRNRQVEKPSIPSIPPKPPVSFPKLDSTKSGSLINNYKSFPNISSHKTKLEDGKRLNLSNIKKEKYMEKVKKFYDKKDKYLKKRASLATKLKSGRANSSEKITTFTDNPFDDMISHMISTITESKSKFYKSFSNSSIETVKGNIPQPNVNASESLRELDGDMTTAQQKPVTVSNQEIRATVKKNYKKRDLYDVAFDENSKKIKREDTEKWNVEKRSRSPHRPLLTKQDPQKSYKDKILIKGHM